MPIELVNVRIRTIGLVEKPGYAEESYAGEDAGAALKGERPVYVPEDFAMRPLPVYDGRMTRHGNRIAGPALFEQVNTTLFLSASYDCVCDKYGSFAVFRKGEESRLASVLSEATA